MAARGRMARVLAGVLEHVGELGAHAADLPPDRLGDADRRVGRLEPARRQHDDAAPRRAAAAPRRRGCRAPRPCSARPASRSASRSGGAERGEVVVPVLDGHVVERRRARARRRRRSGRAARARPSGRRARAGRRAPGACRRDAARSWAPRRHGGGVAGGCGGVAGGGAGRGCGGARWSRAPAPAAARRCAPAASAVARRVESGSRLEVEPAGELLVAAPSTRFTAPESKVTVMARPTHVDDRRDSQGGVARRKVLERAWRGRCETSCRIFGLLVVSRTRDAAVSKCATIVSPVRRSRSVRAELACVSRRPSATAPPTACISLQALARHQDVDRIGEHDRLAGDTARARDSAPRDRTLSTSFAMRRSIVSDLSFRSSAGRLGVRSWRGRGRACAASRARRSSRPTSVNGRPLVPMTRGFRIRRSSPVPPSRKSESPVAVSSGRTTTT